ncbi:hypothetical protein OsJ_23356 [Oryza sativa Japonica Group]|uniref:Uncharacterized protein n=1 Tax=Oryza sativa subsp. japonica TaxID=39947 RepID=A3BH96_ORYSJ|nr:hypothetical protein OsJ_23356 [Oryza sativa Japonica Group]
MEKRNSNDRFFIVNLQPPLAFVTAFCRFTHSCPAGTQWLGASSQEDGGGHNDLAWAQITFQFVPYIKNLEIKTTVTPRCASETFWDSNRMQTHH